MNRSRIVAQSGVIAALYAALTLVVLQLPWALGWGPVQLRLSEALVAIALVTPAAIPGLTIGCAAANAYLVTQVGPVAFLDVAFGSIATLAGAAWTWRFRERPALALAGPVIANALIVPAYLPIMLSGLGFYRVPVLGIDVEGHLLAMYVFGMLAIGIGEAVVVYGLGWPLVSAARRVGVERWLGPAE